MSTPTRPARAPRSPVPAARAGGPASRTRRVRPEPLDVLDDAPSTGRSRAPEAPAAQEIVLDLSTPATSPDAAPEDGVGRPGLPARLLASARAVPHGGTWLGVALSALGVVVLVYGWGKVAGLTSVALQLPYLASAGFAGIALVATGLTIINVAAKQADAAERSQQLRELRDLVAELRRTVTEPAPGDEL